MELRNYQKECIEKIENLPKGSRTVVAIATGLGKTALAAHIKFNRRLLWLSHRDELVRQPERYFTEQGLTFGVEKAEEHAGSESVVSASVQSLYRDERLHKFKPDDFDVIICDEAHHAAAPTYKKILGYFQPDKLIGLTATPKRGDNVRLTDVFDDICFSRDLKWGIENGYLSRIRCLRVQANFDMDKISKQAGDYAASDLENEMQKSDNDIVVTRAYLEYCLPEKKQTLIYCPTLKICRMVLGTLQNALPEDMKDTVCMLSQENTDEERKNIIEGYKSGRILCIINCMILTEGTDLPSTSVIINNRPSANSSLYQQIVGRGTRLCEGKEYCLIIDILGENSAFKELCTAPTLFGLDPDLLPEEIRQKLEQEDLLEISDAFSKERAQTAMQAQIRAEMVDIFTQQRLSMITESAGAKDASVSIADKYAKFIDDQELPYNFKDLIVKTYPDEQHHYRIQPTFNGLIQLSEPDMLDMTVMDIDIPEIYVSAISPAMKMDDAIRLISDVVRYAVPDYYRIKWSRSERARLKDMRATDSQCSRIKTKYAGYNLSLNTDNLSKLQAGDLIDLDIELSEMEKQKKALLKEVSAQNKTRKGKNLEKWIQKQKELEKYENQVASERRRAWDNAYNRLQNLIDKGRFNAAMVSKEREKLVCGKQSVTVKMNYDYHTDTSSPSSKQLKFIDSLLNQIKRNGAKLDCAVDASGMDMWHAGFVITALLVIKEASMTKQLYGSTFKLSGFLQETARIHKPNANNPQTITISVVSDDGHIPD